LRKNKIIFRALYLFFKSNIKMFLRQDSIIVASLFANTQEFFFKISRNVLNYAKNIDAIMSFAISLKMTNINNNHIYNSIVFFD